MPRLSDHGLHREAMGPFSCSDQQGHRQAHQSQTSQAGGGQKCDRLGHGTIQQAQNLEESLRSRINPTWYRSNPSRQAASPSKWPWKLNWAYLAGVGSDPRSFGGTSRRFDLERQVRRYDPHQLHRQRWVEPMELNVWPSP
jgi:hypothetical protein